MYILRNVCLIHRITMNSNLPSRLGRDPKIRGEIPSRSEYKILCFQLVQGIRREHEVTINPKYWGQSRHVVTIVWFAGSLVKTSSRFSFDLFAIPAVSSVGPKVEKTGNGHFLSTSASRSNSLPENFRRPAFSELPPLHVTSNSFLDSSRSLCLCDITC
jgi:hypothetical protein